MNEYMVCMSFLDMPMLGCTSSLSTPREIMLIERALFFGPPGTFLGPFLAGVFVMLGLLMRERCVVVGVVWCVRGRPASEGTRNTFLGLLVAAML
jgi:hypothetical protein